MSPAPGHHTTPLSGGGSWSQPSTGAFRGGGCCRPLRTHIEAPFAWSGPPTGLPEGPWRAFGRRRDDAASAPPAGTRRACALWRCGAVRSQDAAGTGGRAGGGERGEAPGSGDEGEGRWGVAPTAAWRGAYCQVCCGGRAEDAVSPLPASHASQSGPYPSRGAEHHDGEASHGEGVGGTVKARRWLVPITPPSSAKLQGRTGQEIVAAAAAAASGG